MFWDCCLIRCCAHGLLLARFDFDSVLGVVWCIAVFCCFGLFGCRFGFAVCLLICCTVVVLWIGRFVWVGLVWFGLVW